MKTFLISILCAACVSSTIAQLPSNVKDINRPDLIPALRDVQLNLQNPLCEYKPSERVRYVFYDQVNVTEVNDRLMPQAEDYITISTVIGGKQYTLVPANGISIESSRGAPHNMRLVEVTGSDRAAGMPPAATLWRVNRYGNDLALSYNGAFMHNGTPWGEKGGTLGLQSGVAMIGTSASTNFAWTISTVNEGGNNLIQLKNSAEANFLGYCYREGAEVMSGGARQRIISSVSVKGLAAAGNVSGEPCNVKWIYKIYKISKAVGRSLYPASLDPDTYLIRSTIDKKALMAFVDNAVFGATNEDLADMKWKFEITSRGTYFIINSKSGKALGYDKANGKFVFTTINNFDFYKTDAFQWMVNGPAGGRYTLMPFLDLRNPGTGGALTSGSGRTITCSMSPRVPGSHLQEFQISIPNGSLWGYVDMHTHPMSNHGFGGQFFFGACDGDIATALGNCNCLHNFVTPPFDGSCGQQNLIRNLLLDQLDAHPKAAGYPDFNAWPKQSNTTHQQMWWEWIDRARRAGLRTIVALAQNSHALADGLETAGPYDDLRSMNNQIRELIAFVGRHRSVMDTVTSPSRMRDVVSSGKLAVIIGLEMDNIGNFYNPNEKRPGEVYTPNPTEAQVRQEIDRLYGLGVRYIFPVHIVNNVFGGAGVYGDDMEPMLFNLSNYYNTGSPFQVEPVSTAASGIGFKLPDLSAQIVGPAKTLLDIFRHAPVMPLKPDVLDVLRYSNTDPGAGFGHRNRMGLSETGRFALRYMMSKGMMIDVDHMSEKSVSDALREAVRFDYPLNSGHNGPRGRNGSEKSRTNGQYDSLRVLGGMVGVGTGSAEASAFVGTYRQVLTRMGGRNVTIGTDVGVGAKLPAAPGTAGRLAGDLPGIEPCHTGNKTWTFADYNTGGVSHYGMMPEFVRSIENAGLNAAERNAFFGSVEYFAQMWEKCERNKRNVR